MSPEGWLFFALFALSIAAIYIITRRGLLPMSTTAIAGIVADVVLVALISLAQGNHWLHALVVGVLIGTLFAITTMAVAGFFRANMASGAKEGAGKEPEA